MKWLILVIVLISCSLVYATIKPQKCSDLKRAAKGLCNAYCNAMECWNPKSPVYNSQGCESVLEQFRRHSDYYYPPCKKPRRQND
ncbi:MAG TPA: hypothetical protein PKD85_16175 [Saprospiraceae bacterium]|nr:hypothetical protein [Saprospiraceae bacterium]